MSFMTSKMKDYIQLTRMDKPIGTLLLLWPTLWALWIAAEGLPKLDVLFVFTLGVILMRAAGCVINDFADRHVDGHVKRTENRPLASGRISSRAALIFFFCLTLLAFLLVLTMNTLTILLSFVGVGLAACYPFMKRYTHLPQVVLGMAFGWAIPMGFAAQLDTVPSYAWLLFVANILWTVAYDTLYAMVDRDDDLKIGIKSTAILFGKKDKLIVGLLQLSSLLCLGILGWLLVLPAVYFVGLILVAGLFVYQQKLIVDRDRDSCFKAFLHNNYVGMIIFASLFLSYL
ncbi:4-hydroxybenzoate octaprenyltransferase [Moritella viscosa]|uniref:4-hydroxybenzoate octaprenyltransferase n=1 Tax=Moritella viscosa TaxID=80854 RepID=A0A090I8J4_9GAMM|nr:4-hydroxybenzoate octaprenyltransferase [Moritella viscosa]CED58195.1 4-hydroxybenzoate octaprenyltransferase [Moritella viscosa]SGY94306.1 4-hydroxybenzoate octaprenyltransferase-4-HB polyprenyltransferase [Moritella viscosa]SGY99299.1 4-hydroxybenzoate octaprenyltransferase-4-HB polyprenyltransferase [Moritella viscosa]SGZ05797.1 4-hydroxybenzoate octaprenyltransferase-4-HB polyprenyltransferase [Moritella viscosa]SGZ05951.1 4-hydroxybenzoate octaprenyltransferase-4-HB polyprenyltransfera